MRKLREKLKEAQNAENKRRDFPMKKMQGMGGFFVAENKRI